MTLTRYKSGAAVETDFAYRLTYEIRNHSVVVEDDPAGGSAKTKVTLDGTAISVRALSWMASETICLRPYLPITQGPATDSRAPSTSRWPSSATPWSKAPPIRAKG